jgi:hypothetical protein
MSKSKNRLLWIHEMSIIKSGIAVFSSEPNAYVLSIPYSIQVPGSEVWAEDKPGSEPWTGDKLFFQIQRDTIFQISRMPKNRNMREKFHEPIREQVNIK